MPLSSFTAKARPRPQPPPSSHHQQPHQHSSNASTPYHLSPMKYGSVYSPQLANDPLLSGSTPRGKTLRLDSQVGGYPVRFLDLIVRLSKCLRLKRERVNALKDLNATGERRKSFGEYINEDFQRKYAATVIDLSQINRDLNGYLKDIREFTKEFSTEAGPTISLPNIVRENCQEDAYDLVNKSNAAEDKEYVENPKILSLISSLTALMMQVRQLAEGGRSGYELQALQDAIREVKLNLDRRNVGRFEDSVEVHMQHIQSGLSQMGNLHAFNIAAAGNNATPVTAAAAGVKAEPGGN